MTTVEHAIRTFRRDVVAALTNDTSLPGGISLVADRVSLNLAVRFGEATRAEAVPELVVVAAEPGSYSHQITVEFRVVTSAKLAEPPSPTFEVASSRSHEAETSEPSVLPVFETLATVFGAPGFDSAARATVFRETLDALTEAQRREVLTSSPPHSTDEPAALNHARQRVQRLAASGPAGQERGVELLRQLATRVSVGELIAVAAERWQTQSDWIEVAPAQG